MTSRTSPARQKLISNQGAEALLAATFKFLQRNDISGETIIKCARQHGTGGRAKPNGREYKKLMRAYEDLGIAISAWFTNPTFLDKSGAPLPLKPDAGIRSIRNLLRASRVQVPKSLAFELLRNSPSIRTNADGSFSALRRVFVLPEFELPRAALVVERYLQTLCSNATGRKRATALLLERSCHVTRVKRRTIAPILRDIKERGTAFMDAVDGDLEAGRVTRSSRQFTEELGVLVFAWTRPNRIRKK
jgi:hypothetical protein